jgi:hypothetical protein
MRRRAGNQVVQFMKTRKKQSSFTTCQGVLLLFMLGSFFYCVLFGLLRPGKVRLVAAVATSACFLVEADLQ